MTAQLATIKTSKNTSLYTYKYLFKWPMRETISLIDWGKRSWKASQMSLDGLTCQDQCLSKRYLGLHQNQISRRLYYSMRVQEKNYAAWRSVWIKQFLNELKIADFIDVYMLHKVHKINMILTKNVECQSRTKHIDVQHHYIRKLVAAGKHVIKWVCSANILINGFTKTLIVDNFWRYQSLLGLSIWDIQ